MFANANRQLATKNSRSHLSSNYESQHGQRGSMKRTACITLGCMFFLASLYAKAEGVTEHTQINISQHVGKPVFEQNSTESKELVLVINEIDKQSLKIVDEYNRIHHPFDGAYKSIWNDEFTVSQYLELTIYIVDNTNAIPQDNQDVNSKFRLWRSLFLLSKRCRWNQMNLAQSIDDVAQSGIKAAVSKQVENAKAGCDAIDSKMTKYKYDFPLHSN